MTLAQQLQSLYHLINDRRLEDLGLLRIESGKLVTPLTNDVMTLFAHRSKRADEFIEQSVINSIVAEVKASKGFGGINHIGFCYMVADKADEIKRLARAAGSKGYSAYQEPSSDDAAWVFVGDISEITNPLLEFLPHEGQTRDKWVDYWLPHIQIDIDTGLPPDEIKALVEKFIQRQFTPFPIQIDGVTYIQRINLGCLQGVNLMLDLSTSNRDINYRKTWAKLA